VKGSGWDKAPGNDSIPPSGYQKGWVERLPREGYADPDGLETVDAWECAEGCVCAKLGKQSGERPMSGRHGESGSGEKGHSIYGQCKSVRTKTYWDKGTAARFYHQAGWEYECMESCPIHRLDEQAGERGASAPVLGHEPSRTGSHGIYGHYERVPGPYHADSGGASRFYAQADWSHEIAERLATGDPVRYCPKAAKRERNEGLDDFYWRKDKDSPIGFVRITKDEWEALGEEEQRIKAETGKRVSLRAQGNVHPTLKSISLCKWLAALLLPPKEYAPRRILIPFAGTFSEGIGAILAGWDEVVGVEIHEDHCVMAEARAAFWSAMSQEAGTSDPKAILKAANKKPKKEKTGQGKLL